MSIQRQLTRQMLVYLSTLSLGMIMFYITLGKNILNKIVPHDNLGREKVVWITHYPNRLWWPSGYPIMVSHDDQIWIQLQSEPTLELHSRVAPRIRRQYHSSVGPHTGRNPGGGQIKKKKRKKFVICSFSLALFLANFPQSACVLYVLVYKGFRD